MNTYTWGYRDGAKALYKYDATGDAAFFGWIVMCMEEGLFVDYRGDKFFLNAQFVESFEDLLAEYEGVQAS